MSDLVDQFDNLSIGDDDDGRDYSILSGKFRASIEQYSEFMHERYKIVNVQDPYVVETAMAGRGGWIWPIHPHGK